MKNQRKFRKKPIPVDDAEEEEPTGMAVLPTHKQKPKQPKAPKPSRTGLLSFDEDASEAPSPGLRKQPGGQLRPSATKFSAAVAPVTEKRNTYTQVSSTGMHAIYCRLHFEATVWSNVQGTAASSFNLLQGSTQRSA